MFTTLLNRVSHEIIIVNVFANTSPVGSLVSHCVGQTVNRIDGDHAIKQYSMWQSLSFHFLKY